MKKIRVVLIEPSKAPSVTTIDRSLEGMQDAVGGLVDLVPRHGMGDVYVWVNNEGLIHDLPFNRYVGDTPIVGPILVTGGEDEDGRTKGLTDEQVQRVFDHFT